MCAQSQQLAEVSLGSDVEQGHTRRPEHLATHAQQMQAEGHWIHRKGTTNLKRSSFWGGVCPMETQDRGTGMLPWAAEKHSTNMYRTRCPWTPLVHKSKAEGVGREQEIGAI